MSNGTIVSRFEDEQPWGLSQKLRWAFVLLGIYAISPPIVIALARIIGAPVWFMHSLGFLYSPIVFLRQQIELVDQFYDAYRVLMAPWFSITSTMLGINNPGMV